MSLPRYAVTSAPKETTVNLGSSHFCMRFSRSMVARSLALRTPPLPPLPPLRNGMQAKRGPSPSWSLKFARAGLGRGETSQ